MADEPKVEEKAGTEGTDTTQQQPDPNAAKSVEDQELEKKKAELAELEDAKVKALDELQKIRTEKRQAKKDVKAQQPDDDAEAELVIDENDPSAKAWLKQINKTVEPVQNELEREKAEVRQYALDRFLTARPALAKNPNKLKEMMAVYDRIRTSSERTPEGVTLDLEKAYAATFSRELLDATKQARVDDVRQDMISSDPAVSRGATSYQTPTPKKGVYTQDQLKILASWGSSPEEQDALIEEQSKQTR